MHQSMCDVNKTLTVKTISSGTTVCVFTGVCNIWTMWTTLSLLKKVVYHYIYVSKWTKTYICMKTSWTCSSVGWNHTVLVMHWQIRRCSLCSYPGDSDDGQYVSFTEGQVLFIGRLEVILGYTLCASRPRCLNHRGQRGAPINDSHIVQCRVH